MRISDWSSDVCSSDLTFGDCFVNTRDNGSEHVFQIQYTSGLNSQGNPLVYSLVPENLRSELFPQGGRSTWIAVSNDLYGTYDTADVRRDFTIQKGYASSNDVRSEEHTSELQSLMRISYAVFCLKKKNIKKQITK